MPLSADEKRNKRALANYGRNAAGKLVRAAAFRECDYTAAGQHHEFAAEDEVLAFEAERYNDGSGYRVKFWSQPKATVPKEQLALEASMAKPNAGAIYNVCDDEPAAPAEVTTFACSLLGIDPPDEVSFEEAAKTMSLMGRTFWEDNRRVCNDRITDDLGVRLAYPTYREGLRAIYDGEFSS